MTHTTHPNNKGGTMIYLPTYQWMSIIFIVAGLITLVLCWPRKDPYEIIRPEKHHFTLDHTTIAMLFWRDK